MYDSILYGERFKSEKILSSTLLTTTPSERFYGLKRYIPLIKKYKETNSLSLFPLNTANEKSGISKSLVELLY